MTQWTRRKMLSWGFRGAVAAGLFKGYYNTQAAQLEVTRVTVPIPDLPPAFRGVRIAHLTDLHASWIVPNDLFREAARLTMAEQPDLIVLTGDFISGATKFLSGSVGELNRQHLAESVAALAGLAAPLGVFGVLGNHDFWSGQPAVEAVTGTYSRALGVRWLRNEHRVLQRGGAQVGLLGVDDYWESSCSLASAVNGLDPSGVRILLSHNPDINEDIDLQRTRIDLVLSGHTHGGQVVVPLVGQPIMPSAFGQKYRVGLVRDGARQTFISRGVGHLVAPTRFNCPPEVALLTLV